MGDLMNTQQTAEHIIERVKGFVDEASSNEKFFAKTFFKRNNSVVEKPYTDDTDLTSMKYHVAYTTGNGSTHILATREPVSVKKLKTGQFYFVINQSGDEDVAGYIKVKQENGTNNLFYTLNSEILGGTAFPTVAEDESGNKFFYHKILRYAGCLVWADYDIGIYQSRTSYLMNNMKNIMNENKTSVEWINVLDYGIDNSGSVDVADAVQGIIDEIDTLQQSENGTRVNYGLVLYFPCGRYLFSKGISTKATFMRIIGDGHGQDQYPKGSDWVSTLMLAEECTDVTLITQGSSTSNLWVENISLYSYGGEFAYLEDNKPSKGNPCDIAMYLTNHADTRGIYSTKSCNIRDVQFSGFSNYGLSVYQNSKIQNAYFFNCDKGLNLRGYDNIIENCFFKICRIGIYMQVGTIFCHDTWFDQIAHHGIVSEQGLNGMIDGNMDHIGYAGIYSKSSIYNCDIKMRMQRCGCYYAGHSIEEVPSSELYKACCIYASQSGNNCTINITAEYKYEEDGETDATEVHTGKVPICMIATPKAWNNSMIIAPVPSEIKVLHTSSTSGNTIICNNEKEAIIKGKRLSDLVCIGEESHIGAVNIIGKQMPFVNYEFNDENLLSLNEESGKYECTIRVSNHNLLENRGIKSTFTANGLTRTINEDGTITISGTYTGTNTMEDTYILGQWDDIKPETRISLAPGRYYVYLGDLPSDAIVVVRLKSNSSIVLNKTRDYFDVTEEGDYLYAVTYRLNGLSKDLAVEETFEPMVTFRQGAEFIKHEHKDIVIEMDENTTSVNLSTVDKKLPHYGTIGSNISVLNNFTANVLVNYWY